MRSPLGPHIRCHLSRCRVWHAPSPALLDDVSLSASSAHRTLAPTPLNMQFAHSYSESRKNIFNINVNLDSKAILNQILMSMVSAAPLFGSSSGTQLGISELRRMFGMNLSSALRGEWRAPRRTPGQGRRAVLAERKQNSRPERGSGHEKTRANRNSRPIITHGARMLLRGPAQRIGKRT